MELEDDSGTEFQDWEVLHDHQFYSSLSTSSESLIRFDYFSLPNHQTYVDTSVDSSVSKPEEKLSLETNDCFTNTIELWSDSGDDPFDEYQFNKSHVKTDYDGTDITKSVFNSEEITNEAENFKRRESDDGELSCCDVFAGDDLVSIKDMENKRDSEEFGESESSQDEFLDKFCADSSGNESVAVKSVDNMDSVYNSNEELGGEDGGLNEEVNVEIEEEAKSGDVEAKRRLVWWKTPFEVLKYCFLRASPAWSFSLAAAFMGIVILGRRLYKMKRKTKNFQLKIAVDDKRVSQFASRAARMNEAFSMVRRVPVVRASLTAPGVNSWPAMSMR